MATPLPCPCCENKPYSDCCARLHHGEQLATSAEQLMRSRYSAFVLNKWDYVYATWHPSTRPMRENLTHDPQLKWIDLRVITTQSSDDEAFVEFVARYKHNGRAGALRERSRFVYETDRWLYVDGVIE